MATLVTGATGFVGSWLVRELIRRDEGEVRVLHRATSNLEDLEGLTFTSVIGDVTDADIVKEAVKDCDTVYHLAGLVAYKKSERAQMEEVNVTGTRNIVDALRPYPDTRLIYMSSVVAVGASKRPEVMDEESCYTLTGLNLGYFETKRHAEKIVIQACRTRDLNAVILNPSTIYGAGDAKKGSRKTQLKVAQGKFPFYTSGGVSIVAVEDIIAALITAKTKGRQGERYILSGENITIQDLFNRIAKFAGVKPPRIHMPNKVVFTLGRLGDWLEARGKKGAISTENAWTSTMYHWFDHTKAKRELDFNPRPADEALKASVEWMKQKGLLK